MVTKKDKIAFLKQMLATNRAWAIKALVRIYEFQTSQERNSLQTIEDNGVGFSGVDAEILTSFANQWRTRGWLSDKQWAIIFRRIPHYWNQILSLSDNSKLEVMVLSRIPNE